jgi:hypothetical protein
MIDAQNGDGPSSTDALHTPNAHNGAAGASPTPESGEPRDRTASGTAQSRLATPVSGKKAEANRRNAKHSTGPRTEEGKATSRLNALKHGLLAKEIVITRGDYQEDEEAFAELVEELSEQFEPAGVAEELEVQKIAIYYWRTMRAVRYEHGAIRKRTGHMRGREEDRRERDFDRACDFDFSLERSTRGLRWLIEGLEVAKEESLAGQVSPESVDGLRKHFPEAFPVPDEVEFGDGSAEGYVVGPPEYLRELLAGIDEQLCRLLPLREKVAQAEELDLESKVHNAALPGPEVVDKLVRYQTSNERELDKALSRLERMQARRRENGREGGAATGGA